MFFHIQKELSVNSDQSLLLRGTRIVIPSKLQNHVIDLAHEGHQGISRTKQLLREKVWFPTIDKQVEEKVSCAYSLSSHNKTSNIEPLCMPEASMNPLESLSIDFCGPFPSGEYLLVLIDDYTHVIPK